MSVNVDDLNDGIKSLQKGVAILVQKVNNIEKILNSEFKDKKDRDRERR